MYFQILTSYFQSLSDRARFGLSTFLCFLILLLRLGERFKYPSLWAEDGALFLQVGLEKGLQGVFEPYGGYYHTASRLLSYGLLHGVDLTWNPIATLIICLVITALVYSTVTLSAYRWILPSDFARMVTAMLLCLAPGSSEVLGNFTNLHWILYVFLWILALKPAEKSHSYGELFLAVLVCFSTGEVIVLIPLFLWRIYQQGKGRPKVTDPASRSDVFVLGTITVSALLNFVQRQGGGEKAAYDLEWIGRAMLATISKNVVYLPLLGSEVYFSWSRLMNRWYLHLWAFLVLGVVVKSMMRLEKRVFWTIILGLGCALCVPLLTFLVRPDSIPIYAQMKLPASDGLTMRYYFVMAPAAVIFWMVGFSAFFRSKSHLGMFGLMFAALYIHGNWAGFKIEPFGRDQDWYKDILPLKSSFETGCPKEVVVPIYPERWMFGYVSKIEKNCP